MMMAIARMRNVGGGESSARVRSEAAWAEVEEALGEYEDETGFRGPCELLVAAGTS